MPLYPWLLALNDPEKPAGEVRGLGLVNWRVCIGTRERVIGSKRAFMILKEKIVLCYFREVRRGGGHTNIALICAVPIHIFLWWWRNYHN